MATLKPFSGELDKTEASSTKLKPFNGTLDGESPSLARRAGDVGISLLKGAIAIPEAAVGLADIPTGGRVGKFLENEGGAVGFRPKQAKEILSNWQSDDLKAKQQQFQNAEGVVDKVGVALSNPSLIANAAVESVPLMGAGGVLGRGLMAVAPKLGAVGAGAIGEGVVGAGSAAEQIRQETNDGLLTAKQAGLAGLSGAATAGFGALGGKVAQKLGIGDVDTILTQGAINTTGNQATKGLLRRGAEGALSEGILEELPQSLSEQAIQNAALNKPLTEGLADAGVMGALTGGVMGGGAGVVSGFGAKQESQPAQDPAADQPAPPALGYNPRAGAATVFPDGSVIMDSETPAGEKAVFDKRYAPQPVKPSEAMGLDPAAGPMSAAATMAVDGGATAQVQQEQALQQAAAEGPKSVYVDNASERDQQLYQQETDYQRSKQGVADRRKATIEGMLERAAMQGNNKPAPSADDSDIPFGAANGQPDATRGTQGNTGAASRMAGTGGTQADVGRVPGTASAAADGQPKRFPALTGQQPTGKATTGQKVKSLKELIARKKAEREALNVQNAPQGAAGTQATQAQADQAPQAMGGQPAGPAAGVSREGSAGVEAAGVSADAVGDERQFTPETGTLGIPRSDMPQVPTASHGGLTKHLNAKGIAHKTTMVDAGQLKPTQAEYSPSKVEAAKTAEGDRAVIVSSDGHIIDGHHQALAAAQDGKPVKAIVLDAPVEQALQAVKDSPSAKPGPVSPGTAQFLPKTLPAVGFGNAEVPIGEVAGAGVVAGTAQPLPDKRQADTSKAQEDRVVPSANPTTQTTGAQIEPTPTQAVETTQEGPQQAPGTEPAASVSKYQLPEGRVSDSWVDGKKRSNVHPDFEPTPRQQELMDAVAKALDEGAFYNRDVDERVASMLGVTPDQRARNSHNVEGGDFGYDVYHARKAVEAKRRNANQKEIAKELNLKPGDKLGTLMFNDGKVTSSVEVVSVSDDGLSASFKGKRGPVGVTFNTEVSNVKYAIERAHERGKRKDSPEQFIAGRKGPAVPAEPQETTHNGTRLYRTRINMGGEPKSMWAVESQDNKARRVAGQRTIGGDSLHDTIEQAKAAAEREAKRDAADRAAKAEQEAADKARLDAEEARKASNRGKSIFDRRKDAVLDKQVRDSETGKVMTRREWVENKVAAGLATRITQEDKIKPLSRMQAFRADNRQQAEHDRKVKEAGKKDVYWLGDFEVTKIEYEYAQEVMAKKAAPAVVEQESVAQAAPTDFIRAPDGGLDYGEITPEMGKAMRRQAGKIRLRRGDETQGLVHIEQRHNKDFAAFGFDSAIDFITQVAKGFNKIYKGRGAALDVVIDDEARGMLIVSLEASPDGDFYDIKTATPIRRDQFKNEKPLWERAGPSTPTVKNDSPPYPKGQSGAISVPQPTQEAQVPPGRVYLAVPFAEKDYAKKFGAKWDESKKLWYADPITGEGQAAGEINQSLNRYIPNDYTAQDRYNYYGTKEVANVVAINAGARDGAQYEVVKRKHPDGMMMWSVVPANQAEAQADTPKMSQGFARGLMAWQDLGQTNGVKAHILTFYGSREDFEAKRGRMTIATVTKEVDGKNWTLDATGEKFAMLGMAKKKAEEAGMTRAIADGFVEGPFDRYAEEAKAYGYNVGQDGSVSRGDKVLGIKLKEEKGRLRVESGNGNLLFSGPQTGEALGGFLHKFYGAEKGGKAQSRDAFTLERVNQDTGRMEPVTFQRGETVKLAIGQRPYKTGVITGISHAERTFKVDGREHGLDFGYAYKADFDELAGPRKEVDASLDSLEKRLDEGNAIQSEGFIHTAKETIERNNLGDYAKDRIAQLARRAADVSNSVLDKMRAAKAEKEQAEAQKRAEEQAKTAEPKPPIEMTMEEWKAVPKDFKGTIDGQRTVMRDGGMRAVTIVKAEASESKTPTVDRHIAVMDAVRAGTATPEQFKASFDEVVVSADAIKAELDAKTKAELLRFGGPFVQMRYANEKKAVVADAVYRELVGEYALGSSVTYGMGKGSYEAAVRKMVEATDADKLAQYVKDRQAAIEEAEAKRTARAAAIENPQSLNDYRILLNTHIREGMTRKEAFLTLTPEQRVRYDELEAEGTRDTREAAKRAAKTAVRAAGQSTGGEIIATKHTRDGYDLFVVQLSDRLSREDYQTVLASAKRMGGWYSAFRGNGAIPGFQFKDRDAADAFLKLAGGDTSAAREQAAQRRDAFEDDRSQTAVERLREMADRTEDAANEELGRDRKANTERRARFASAALNAAEASKAMAKTMRNIAQAIEDGKAKFLDAVRTRTQVETLMGYVRTAKDNELRAKHPSYAEQEKRKGEPATAETADFAEFPAFTAFRSDLASLGRQMLEVEGTKKLGQRLMSVADDVTDAYLDFAKQNLDRVSQFGRGDALADFASRDMAERALKRSGLTGKAIVLPVKRGQNRVILSPSEAINRGIWQGDGDKRITLNVDFGNELVEAIGRRGNKQNGLTVPWQFQTAYDRRKALSRMGIETPSEFRSALREFIGLQERAVANRVRELELSMTGRKADGLDFFPTPAEIADQMVEAADIQPDMAVLEPSAGMGHIADRIRAAGAEPDVIELSGDRRELLQEKGYNLSDATDFLDLKPREFFTYGDVFRAPDGTEGIMRGAGSMGSQRVRLVNEAGDMVGAGFYDRADLTGIGHRGTMSGYDRIIMNPPFSNRRDAEHVRHAFDLLKPGGRIVAIMGEGVFFGQDKKAQDFRDWLESVGGTSEKLPDGSFMDPSLPVNTGVNARMVVIDKPAGDVAFSRSPATQAAYEARIDALFDGSKANEKGVRVLDHSDMLGMLGLGDGPVNLAEGKVLLGRENHPRMTAEIWKKVPQWLENPAAVFDSDTVAGRLVFVAPDLVNGASVRLIVEPNVKHGRNEVAVHLLQNAYDAPGKTPFGRWVNDNKLRYIDKKVFPAIVAELGLQLPNAALSNKPGTAKILTEKNLAGYRRSSETGFSRGAGKGMPVSTTQQIVTAIRSKWANAPDVVVVASMQDPLVPEAARAEDARQKSLGATGESEGFIYKGKVYVVSGELATPTDVIRVVFHEALGHYGLHKVFGKELGAILNQIATMRKADVKAKAEQYGLDLIDPKQRLMAAEEVLAEMAQTRPDMGFVKRAIAAIRNWLRTHVPGFKDMELTDADIIQGYILPARAYVERGAQVRTEKVGGMVPAFSRTQDQTQTDAFKAWFGDSKVVDADGKPLVVYHGTAADVSFFDKLALGESTKAQSARSGFFFAASPKVASGYAMLSETRPALRNAVLRNAAQSDVLPADLKQMLLGASEQFSQEDMRDSVWIDQAGGGVSGANVLPVYLSIKNPMVVDYGGKNYRERKFADVIAEAKAAGHDGVVFRNAEDSAHKDYSEVTDIFVAFEPTQIKSATGNNGNFDPANPDIRFSRSTMAEAARDALNNVREMSLPAGYTVNDLFKKTGKVSWWHKTVGTMYDLSRRSRSFARVFNSAQDFLNDVSYYATEAANKAPTILPKLESLADITKTPIKPEDNKAIAAPIFEGTLTWGRDPATGKPIKMAVLEERAAQLSTQEKGQELIRQNLLDPKVLRMWQGMKEDQYTELVESKYEREVLKPGIVFTPAELKAIFKLTDGQVKLYQEFRAAVDQSLKDMAVADMVRFGGKDVAVVREKALAAKTVDDAAKILREFLLESAEMDAARGEVLNDTANRMLDKAAKVRDLMERGYAPLSRFGQYSLDVVDENDERVYFGLFETQREANKMARQMLANYPKATINQGTVSQEAYKLFAGVSPETLELFGEMLGLEADGQGAANEAFQSYLKMAKANRSAMKRLIHRKGIAGFSEDPGRVLAGFVYSNARQAASGLHMGELDDAVSAIPKQQGELSDVAVKLRDYIKNPQEEAHQIRGLLFAQYLGGSVASAALNALQPVQVTMPWLSQFGGIKSAAVQLKQAIQDVLTKANLEPALAKALTKAEEDGIVSPQEIFHLQAQARGQSPLQSGDGTRLGDALAKANNTMSKVSLAWGKLFGAAEQFNRRTTFIAAYRTAVAQGMANPAGFAERAVNETQFVYSKANKPQWARGAVGATLFTFKQYSISYVELMHRMWTQGGPEGKKAALLGIAVLFLVAGAGGLPFADDMDDLIDGFMQRVMGRNFNSKRAKEQFFADVLGGVFGEEAGKTGAQIMMRGISGLPGSPIDVSGRMGLGNLIPGTGIFQKKQDYTRDVMEIAGPAGDLAKRAFQAGGKALQGDVLGTHGALMTISPTAARNLGKAYEMATTGMYLDDKGKKVIDANGWEALGKSIGFQPNSVKRTQEATGDIQGMVALNRLRESEIADKWAMGVFLGDPDKVAEAKQELAEWNTDNPDTPIRIKPMQIASRVKTMRMNKDERIAKTAPKELRGLVRSELAGVER